MKACREAWAGMVTRERLFADDAAVFQASLRLKTLVTSELDDILFGGQWGESPWPLIVIWH